MIAKKELKGRLVILILLYYNNIVGLFCQVYVFCFTIVLMIFFYDVLQLLLKHFVLFVFHEKKNVSIKLLFV